MIAVFNWLSLCARVLTAMLLFGAVQAEEVTWFTVHELQVMRADAHCSISEQLYQQCFDMTLAECSSVYQATFATCDQLDSDAFFDLSDQTAVDRFNECYQAEFDKYLKSKGVNLDEECEY